MPKAKRKLWEVKISSGKTTCKVSRSFVEVQTGDRIRFRNRTAGKIHVQVSENRLFGNSMFTIQPNHDKTVITHKVGRGVYPYAVFCEHKARFCIGSSMPIIIVPR